MCFGGGGSKPQTVVQTSSTNIPAWMEKAGEAQYGQAKGLASEGFPQYGGQRLAEFGPDTLQGFEQARGNVGSWRGPFDQAMGLTQQSAAPVGDADLSRYMNPFTQNVLEPTISEMVRQHERDRIQRNATMSQRGSYLNEDRRMAMEQTAREGLARQVGMVGGGLQMQAFRDALGQANVERGRQQAAGGMFAQLAPQRAQLGYTDVAALSDIGAQQQGQTQQNLNLAYQDFLNQFYFPQEQQNWLASQLQSVPYSSQMQSSSTGPVGTPNAFAQNMGGFGALLGGLGMFGKGWK